MRTVKLIVILILTAAIGILMIQNRAPVQARILFYTAEMSLILLLILTTGAGFLLGVLLALFMKSGKKAKT